MRKYRADVGKFPTGIVSARLFYRKAGQKAWHRFHESRTPVFSAIVPQDGDVDIRAYAVDERGAMASVFRESRAKEGDTIQDRPAVDDVVATPVARQDGPNVSVGAFVISTEKADEYEVEVRTSDNSTAAEDAVTQGIVEASTDTLVTLPPDESTVRVHTRVTRKADQVSSDWTTTAVEVVDPPVAGVADHSTDFAGGTLESSDGQAVLEISSGDLRQTALVIDDLTTGVIDDYTNVLICDAGDYWSPAVYTTANIVLDAPQDIHLQLHPKTTSITRETRVIDDWFADPICYPTEDASGNLLDYRIVQRSTEGMEDQTPVQVDWSVATSSSSSPTFVDADFTTYYPGVQLPGVRTYAVRAAIKTWFNRLVTIDEIQVRRWIFCKSKPWCSHAETGELVWYHETTGNENDLVFAFDGAEFDRITLEIDWTGQGSLDDELIAEINSSASNQVVITPAAYDVESGKHERVRMQFFPNVGQYRRFAIEQQYEYTDAGAVANVQTNRVVEWNNTSTEITSLRFTTNGSGFASGSSFRAWGHRKNNGA